MTAPTVRFAFQCPALVEAGILGPRPILFFKYDEIENKMAHTKASYDTLSQTSQSPKGSDCFHTTPHFAVVPLVRQ